MALCCCIHKAQLCSCSHNLYYTLNSVPSAVHTNIIENDFYYLQGSQGVQVPRLFEKLVSPHWYARQDCQVNHDNGPFYCYKKAIPAHCLSYK